MNIVVVAHPVGFLGSQSMPRLAQYVTNGLRERGHQVQLWSARSATASFGVGKWWGYVEQFVFFSVWLWCAARRQPGNTVYFFLDQALAPWVWCVGSRPHVIQVNDLLAVRSAHGEFSQNPVGWTGRVYQTLIAAGLKRARQFIAISEATRRDVVVITGADLARVEKIYVGLNHPYRPMEAAEQIRQLSALLDAAQPDTGYLLHVGGNQWYKNRGGVLRLYAAYVARHDKPPHLWVVGAAPTSDDLAAAAAIHQAGGRVRFWTGVGNDALNVLYAGARLMLFPSLAEGFGWPIAEAMACGCPVLTTHAAPMTEVGGDAAFYLPPMPAASAAALAWAAQGADTIYSAITLPVSRRAEVVAEGFRQVEQFATAQAIDRYAAVCERLLDEARADAPCP